MKLHEGLYFGKNSISHSTSKKQISMLKSISLERQVKAISRWLEQFGTIRSFRFSPKDT